MNTLSGNCMCCSVTWSYSGETTRNLVCHCTDCQRATSAPFTAFIGMTSEALQWSGNITHYESSPSTFRGFCPVCGTRLYFRSDRWPHETHVHAHTLRNPSDYQPTAQVMMRSKASWLDGLDAIPVHEQFQKAPATPT
jgi:hypothetical protein